MTHMVTSIKAKSTLLIALGLSAAFDTVEHSVLLTRLENSFSVWHCQGMDSILPRRPYAVCSCRLREVCCYHLLMRSTSRVCTEPAARRRLHMPSSQYCNKVWRVSSPVLTVSVGPFWLHCIPLVVTPIDCRRTYAIGTQSTAVNSFPVHPSQIKIFERNNPLIAIHSLALNNKKDSYSVLYLSLRLRRWSVKARRDRTTVKSLSLIHISEPTRPY